MPKGLGEERRRDVLNTISAIEICKEFKWDYWTLKEQPPFFLETIDNYFRALKDTDGGRANNKS